MNCHLIPDEKFTDKVVEFLTDSYGENNNEFIIYNENKKFYKGNYDNVFLIDDILEYEKKVYKILSEADRIFIHGFGAEQIITFFNRHLSLMKKCVVIIWGGDLYNDHIFLEQHKKLCLRLRVKMLLKKRVISRTPAFMTFTCSDYDKAKLWYNAKGKQYDCLYPSNLEKEKLKKIEKKSSSDFINIVVGNSAAITNNHLEALELIHKYSKYNVKVFCPLSYGGNEEYIDKVISLGKKLFSDKFIPMLDYMTIDEYSQFLADMDVAILAFDRQQATANIEILAYFGAKIFVKRTCALWDHYVERDKCVFFDLESIKKLKFEEFCSISKENQLINKKYFSKIWSVDYLRELWDKVLYFEK